MGRRISIHEAPLWAHALKGKLREAAVRGLQAAAHRTVREIQTRIIPEENPEPVDRGAYRAGFHVREEEDGALIENTVPHASFIERGVRGQNVKIGRAMIDALQAWVMRKGMIGKLARRGTRKRGAQENLARAIAWAIATSMTKKGIFNRDRRGGLRVMEKASRLIPRFIAEEIHAEIERVKHAL